MNFKKNIQIKCGEVKKKYDKEGIPEKHSKYGKCEKYKNTSKTVKS